MKLLLDTHAWVWSLTGSERLSLAARQALEQADRVFVSSISLFEIGQKVRLGKWPEMEAHLDRLQALLEAQGGRFLPLKADACLLAATLDWSHRDPFDRFIAASAITEQLLLVSADAVFDDLVGSGKLPERCW